MQSERERGREALFCIYICVYVEILYNKKKIIISDAILNFFYFIYIYEYYVFSFHYILFRIK
jgi:hypothetical protein